jgi:hypothetical protein
MSAIAWTYPVLLLLVRRLPAAVTRPILGFIGLLAGAQALLHAATGLWIEDGSDPWAPPQWTLQVAVAALAFLARPPRSAVAPAPPTRRGPRRLVLLWLTIAFAAVQAIFHTALATLQSWPAALLASDTAGPPTRALYAMWLFSCVLFFSVPTALVWSLWAPAAGGRFVVRYAAVLIAILMVSWAGTMTLGHGPDLPAIGPLSLGLLAALTALSAPPRPRPTA